MRPGVRTNSFFMIALFSAVYSLISSLGVCGIIFHVMTNDAIRSLPDKLCYFMDLCIVHDWPASMHPDLIKVLHESPHTQLSTLLFINVYEHKSCSYTNNASLRHANTS